jgi:hypothetical protein
MEKEKNDEIVETNYQSITNKLYIRYNTKIQDFSVYTSVPIYKDEIIGLITGFVTRNP